MTTTYDVLGAPSQLGGDLQGFSSNGWPPPWPHTGDGSPVDETFWDGRTPDGFDETGSSHETIYSARSLVDMCVHAGQLHVAWVEPQWNGSAKVMRGPFVKKWDGAAWVAVGGEVDPAITPLVLSQAPNPSGAVGTRGAPGHPKIVSDGTSLYVAYTVREVANVVAAPPVGSWVPGQACGCYVGGCDLTDYAHWTPRKAYVRKWSGASWDLYGDLPATTNNVFGQHGLDGPNQPWGRMAMTACASAADPGIVYVFFAECGGQSAVAGWSTGPSCLFGIQFGTPVPGGESIITRVVKFNGVGTAGTSKTINEITHPTSDYPATYPNLQLGGPFGGFVDNSTGTPWVFWTNAIRPGFGDPLVFRMTNWDTLVDAQTYPDEVDVQAYGHDATNNFFYIQKGRLDGSVLEVKDDGTAAFEPLNFAAAGMTAWVPFGAGQNVFSERLAPDGIDLWAVTAAPHATPGGTDYMVWYHPPCSNWSAGDYATGDKTTLVGVGELMPVVLGDTMYVAGAFHDPANPAADLKVKVFAAAICRGCASCSPGVNADPFVKAHFALAF